RGVVGPHQGGVDLERPDLAGLVHAPFGGGARLDLEVLVDADQRLGEQVGARGGALVDRFPEVDGGEVAGVVVGDDEDLLVGRGGVRRGRSGGGGGSGRSSGRGRRRGASRGGGRRGCGGRG